MSVTQKMFVSGGFLLAVVLVFTQAVPVPVPADGMIINPEYRQFVSAAAGEMVQEESAGEPAAAMSVQGVVDPAVQVRPVRSASPFFGIFSSYERPYKTQHHHHHHHEEEYEPEHHHRPHYQKPHYGGGGGAGSFASAGSFAGGQGGGGHSQSAANSQSASFGFGPFQASYSASSAHSGSHSRPGGGFSDY